MKRFVVVAVCVVCFSSVAAAQHFFASITAVDADKAKVTYKIGKLVKSTGKTEETVVTAKVAKDCVIRSGSYRLGKPARAIEGDELVNGLKNFVFQNASAEIPLKVSIFTADKDDKDKGVSKGDIVKILVNSN